jgi:LPS O-antigen subunit length determinant protein (WzzB/FepE family)
MTPLTTLQSVTLAVIISLFSFGGWQLYSNGKTNGAASVQVKWDREKISVQEQSLAIEVETRLTEQRLKLSVETLRKSKDAEITKLNAAVTIALNSLRFRATNRPVESSSPAIPPTGTSCTGANLYGQDAEFLIREAARADTQRLQLIEYQSAYNAARSLVK